MFYRVPVHACFLPAVRAKSFADFLVAIKAGWMHWLLFDGWLFLITAFEMCNLVTNDANLHLSNKAKLYF
jgi:hypothetical protein